MAEPSSYRPREIPEEPGVYRFYNADDKVIYVGKAKNLKNRLTTYFGSNLAQKTYRMVHEAVRVDWTIVATELEALALRVPVVRVAVEAIMLQNKDGRAACAHEQWQLLLEKAEAVLGPGPPRVTRRSIEA